MLNDLLSYSMEISLHLFFTIFIKNPFVKSIIIDVRFNKYPCQPLFKGFLSMKNYYLSRMIFSAYLVFDSFRIKILAFMQI